MLSQRLNTLGNPTVLLTISHSQRDTNTALKDVELFMPMCEADDQTMLAWLKKILGDRNKIETINASLIAAQSATMYAMLNSFSTTAVKPTCGISKRLDVEANNDNYWWPRYLRQTRDLKKPFAGRNISADQERMRINMAVIKNWVMSANEIKNKLTQQNLSETSCPKTWRLILMAAQSMGSPGSTDWVLEQMKNSNHLYWLLWALRKLVVTDRFTPCLAQFVNPLREKPDRRARGTARHEPTARKHLTHLIPLVDLIPEDPFTNAYRNRVERLNAGLRDPVDFDSTPVQMLARELVISGERAYDPIESWAQTQSGRVMADKAHNIFLPASYPQKTDTFPRGTLQLEPHEEEVTSEDGYTLPRPKIKVTPMILGVALVFLRTPRPEPGSFVRGWVPLTTEEHNYQAHEVLSAMWDHATHRKIMPVTDRDAILERLRVYNTGLDKDPVDHPETEPSVPPTWWWAQETVRTLSSLAANTLLVDKLMASTTVSNHAVDESIDTLREYCRLSTMRERSDEQEQERADIFAAMKNLTVTRENIVGDELLGKLRLALHGPGKVGDPGEKNESAHTFPLAWQTPVNVKRAQVLLHYVTYLPLRTALVRMNTKDLAENNSEAVKSCLRTIEKEKIPTCMAEINAEIKRLAEEMLLSGGHVGPWMKRARAEDPELSAETRRYLTFFGHKPLDGEPLTPQMFIAGALSARSGQLASLLWHRGRFRRPQEDGYTLCGVYWAKRDSWNSTPEVDLFQAELFTHPLNADSFRTAGHITLTHVDNSKKARRVLASVTNFR